MSEQVKLPPVVQLEVGRAIEEALASDTELFDAGGDRIEDFEYIAQVALTAAFPAVIAQRDAEWRSGLLGDEAVEAAADAHDALHNRNSIETVIAGVLEAAIDKGAPGGGGE